MRCLTAALVALALVLPVASAHPEDPDCGLALDAGDSFSYASAVALPVSCSGQLHSSWDSTDFYKFSCAAGQTVRATVSSASVDITVRAYAPVYTRLALAEDSTYPDGVAELTFTCPIPGEYRLQLLHGGLTPGLYYVPYAMSAHFA